MSEQYQPTYQPYVNPYLKQASDINDPNIRNEIQSKAGTNFLGIHTGDANGLSSQAQNAITASTGKTPQQFLNDTGLFGSWGAYDALNKASSSGVQAQQAQSLQQGNYVQNQMLADAGEERQAKAMTFQTKLQGDLQSQLLDKQGELNMRQSMFNAAAQRAGAIAGSPIHWLT